VGTPTAGGFAFFGWKEAPDLGDPVAQADLWARKAQRPAWDLYAAFDPFNEAQRAILPLVPRLRRILKPGDFILDLSCRTGWTGACLAGLFPSQRVVSAWVGERDVLGVRGFAWWLPRHRRPDNWDVVFLDPHSPLPFLDSAFGLVHGFDLVHHADPEAFFAECQRVVRPGGAHIFPHVHLCDTEPDPWFEREGTLRSQRDYAGFMERHLGADQQGFVLSEKALLGAPAAVQPEQVVRRHHYNACLYAEPRDAEGAEPTSAEPVIAEQSGHRVLLSPLVDLDAATGWVHVDPTGMAGGAGELLRRHPVHADRLTSGRLDPVDRALLYEAVRLNTIEDCARRVGLGPAEAVRRFEALQDREWVRIAPIPAAMARLQTYYRTQQVQPLSTQDTLLDLWQDAIRRHSSQPLWFATQEGSVFRYFDADLAVRMTAALLRDNGVGPGSRVLAQSVLAPELPLLFWATALLGASFVPISDAMGEQRVKKAIDRIGPVLTLIGDTDRWPTPSGTVLGFGQAERRLPSFAEAASQVEPLAEWPTLAPDHEAAVLFTSASTGAPKGVRLSHGSLVRSARSVARCFALAPSDRLLGTGGVHTMSGLRNACIVPVVVGASLLIPEERDVNTPDGVASVAARWGATIVTTTPAWLAGCLRSGPRLRPLLQALRGVLCTGAPLPTALRLEFSASFGVPVLNYYGLTETGGLCIAVDPGLADLEEPGVGRPANALVDIRDAANRSLPAGETGLLWVYTENLALGYLSGAPLSVDANGWYRTGDRARLTPQGCVVLEGRADRLLLHHNGENIQPEEIEEALIEIGGFVQAHACSRRGPDGIDRIVALVVGRGTQDRALEFAIAARLSQAHVPDLILVVEELPLGPAGKVDPQRAMALLDRTLEKSA
jgi:acyl-coenzyme A synthetase/AMP-(fatty) acid ligase/SAM-dependent methyltransferase